ncbi:hypothetical protein THRCLA_05623 [Thraustotheca clavata]|uniref:HTH myb-type domain-containing protein n=1 Tax=Thraustotheca clavata TaxID=74557 RepID=A0A1V9ZVB2_9STRA|nr:hypothetical protein THRCLA_05623 [Thraustotheca clavata]
MASKECVAPLIVPPLKRVKNQMDIGSPTSPGMSHANVRREVAENAAFRGAFSGESSPEEEGDSDNDVVRDCKPNTGRWTDAEHKLFLKGLECFPYRAWKKIATLIKTRSVVQIRTHAQKYYQKLAKEEAKGKERENHFAAYNEHERKLANLKKHKYSFDDSHYTRKLMRDREAKLHSMDTMKSPFLRSSVADVSLLKPRNVCVDVSVELNQPGSLQLRRAMPLTRGMLSLDTSSVMDFPEDKLVHDYDPSLARLSPVSSELLQGTDEDWFSSSNSEVSFKDDKVPDASPLASPLTETPSKKNQFMPIYHCDTSFDFNDSTDLILFEDDAPTDDFILDPQTFLTCYFNKDTC